MLQTALFGIPNLRVRVPDLARPAKTKQVTEEELEPLGADLYRRGFNLVPNLQQVGADDGAYFGAYDRIVNRPGRPIQPRFTWSVREPNLAAHGVFLREAICIELHDFNPTIARPTTDGDVAMARSRGSPSRRGVRTASVPSSALPAPTT